MTPLIIFIGLIAVTYIANRALTKMGLLEGHEYAGKLLKEEREKEKKK